MHVYFLTNFKNSTTSCTFQKCNWSFRNFQKWGYSIKKNEKKASNISTMKDRMKISKALIRIVFQFSDTVRCASCILFAILNEVATVQKSLFWNFYI